MSVRGMAENKSGLTFNWKIKQFTLCSLRGEECLCSPVFRTEMLDNTEWILKLYPRRNETDVVLNICRQAKGPKEISVDVELFIRKINGCNVSHEQKNITFSEYHVLVEPLKYLRRAIFHEEEIFLPEGTLTVGCCLKKPSDSNHSTCIPVECNACTQISGEQYSVSLPVIFPFGNIPSQHSIVALNSVSFSALNSVSTKYPEFNIALQSRGYLRSTENMSLSIMAVSSFRIFAKCKVSLQDMEGVTQYLFEGEHWYEANLNDQKWELKNSVIHGSSESKCSDTGAFIMSCTLGASNAELTSFIESIISAPQSCETWLQNIAYCIVKDSTKEKFKVLYTDKKLCDFTFLAQDKEFRVHKAILGAASPVFCAMFERDMSEKATSTAIIDDIDSDISERLILFAYTETIENLQWDRALKLFSAADKYQILELKSKCADFLKSNLTVENVSEVLAIADLHQDNVLLKAAFNFVYDNSKKVFRSDEWKIFMENYVKTASKTMHEVCIRLTEIHLNS